MSALALPSTRRPRAGLTDPRTYRRTLHLLLDLPVGIVTFTAAVTLVSVSAALALTLVGIPLLALTLAGARAVRSWERRRAAVLLAVDLPPDQPPPTGWRRLSDPTAWRAVAYSVLMLPVGVLSGSAALAAWAVAIGGVTYPAFGGDVPDAAPDLGFVTGGGFGTDVTAVAVGFVALLLIPTVVTALARLDTWVARGLLR